NAVEARAVGWTVEQTSWTNPGSVSAVDRVPPPTVDAASNTTVRRPARAIVTAAMSPFGPDPTTTASYSLMLSRSRPCGPGRSGPAHSVRSYSPALGPTGRAARAPLTPFAHTRPLSALRAGPLGPRSLRSLMLSRS